MSNLININENWVLHKFSLTTDEAYKKESLSLIGSYNEKISSLGRSLCSFHNLRHLDLSRNHLESLEGLSHLKFLESLNLYLNNICSIKKLARLKYNKSLTEIDLRLNPVSKEEPNYRLFLIHMLLRLRKLDGIGIYDRDREAAMLYFNSDQAHDFSFNSTFDSTTSVESRPNSSTQPRLEMVKRASHTHSVLDDDDVTLLNLLSENRKSVPNPRISSPSSPNHNTSNIPKLSITDTTFTNILDGQILSQLHDDVIKHHKSSSNPSGNVLGNIYVELISDYLELMRQYCMDGISEHFTKNLNQLIEIKFSEIAQKEESFYNREQLWVEERNQLDQQISQLQQINSELEDKVAEYCKKNQRIPFLESELSQLRATVTELNRKNKLQIEQLSQQMSSQESLRDERNFIMKSLEDENYSMQAELKSSKASAEENSVSLMQMRELAAMLQESHKVLVTNNEKLLFENQEIREKHEQEVTHLHLTYKQLRKSVDAIRESS